MKKILITASTFPRWKGDSEPRFILDLAISLSKFYDVTVLVPSAPGAKKSELLEEIKVVRYHYFPIHKFETLCYPGAIVPRIREKKIRVLLVPLLFISLYINVCRMVKDFDMILANWIIPQGIIQAFIRKPYVIVGHGGDVTSLNKGVIKYLKKKCLQRADAVVVVSDKLKENLKVNYGVSDVSVISMGVNTKIFRPQNYEADYFGQGNKPIILFVGRLAEKKGVRYLIEAMVGIDAKLVIVGDGPLKESIKDHAFEKKIDVIFLGAKTHDELRKIYASSDIFVVPSITAKDGDQEGLPTVIMEALASGLPVVASDSGGISMLIKDGYNGFLCKEKDVRALNEKIRAILSNSNLKRELVSNALESCKEYDYKVIASKYMSVIESCLEGRME